MSAYDARDGRFLTLLDSDGQPPCQPTDDCQVCELFEKPAEGETWQQWYARVDGEETVAAVLAAPIPATPPAFPPPQERMAMPIDDAAISLALADLREQERAVTRQLLRVRGGIAALENLGVGAVTQAPTRQPESAPPDAQPATVDAVQVVTPTALLSFGVLLRRHRQGAGLTQAALSAASGLDQSWVSQIETGRKRPGYEAVAKLAATLGLAEEPARELLRVGGFNLRQAAS